MKVLLVDDHAMFREGISLLLRPLMAGLEIREARTWEDAAALLEREGPVDLVLLDLGLPGLTGLDGLRELRSEYPDTPVVVLSSSEDRQTVLQALDAGAMGFIPKSSSSAILGGALSLVLAKGIYLPPSVFLQDAVIGTPKQCVDDDKKKDRTLADLGLTARQGEVLYQVLQGKSSKLIARDLALSSSTVKAHTSAVLRALNVTTRTQAVVAAGRIGLRF